MLSSAEIKRIWETREIEWYFISVPIQDEIVNLSHNSKQETNGGSSTVGLALFPFCTWAWVSGFTPVSNNACDFICRPDLPPELVFLSADLTCPRRCLASGSKAAHLKQSLPPSCTPIFPAPGLSLTSTQLPKALHFRVTLDFLSLYHTCPVNSHMSFSFLDVSWINSLFSIPMVPTTVQALSVSPGPCYLSPGFM